MSFETPVVEPSDKDKLVDEALNLQIGKDSLFQQIQTLENTLKESPDNELIKERIESLQKALDDTNKKIGKLKESK